MAPKTKSPSEGSTGKRKRTVRPKPSYDVSVPDILFSVEVPTVDNLKRSLGAASGKSASRLLKLDSLVKDARMTKDGALELVVGLSEATDGAVATAEAE